MSKTAKIITSAALSLALLGSVPIDINAHAGGWKKKRVAGHVTQTTTVTTTTTTVTSHTTVKRHQFVKRHSPIRTKKVRHHRQAGYVSKLRTKKVRVKHPRNARHYHTIGKHHGYGHSHPGQRLHHSHGRYLSHTHGQSDFIHVRPKARKWPSPRFRSSLDVFKPFPWEVKAGAGTNLALVVVEKQAGVNIIRNVKTQTSTTQPVREKIVIGSTNLARPGQVLDDRQIETCNRPLKIIKDGNSATVIRGNAGYCQ